MDLMDYRRKIIASSPHLSHAEGTVATFSDGTDLPLKNLMVNIEPVQSGTGDPSPSNIRPISGWDAVGVHNGNTVVTTISLGRTVYGGTLNVLTGELVVDRAMVDLGTLNWNYVSVNKRFTSTDIASTAKSYPNQNIFGLICSHYSSVSQSNDNVWMGWNGQLNLIDSRYTDVASFKTAMSGVQLVYELATPQTYTLDPQTVRSLVGHNNIFADTGNTSLDYWAHP